MALPKLLPQAGPALAFAVSFLLVGGFLPLALVAHAPFELSGPTADPLGAAAPQAPTTYVVNFTESGLPSGTLWSVDLGGTTENTTSFDLTFHEKNESYSYEAYSANGAPSPWLYGNLTVDGSSVLVPLHWGGPPAATASNNAAGLFSTGAFLVGFVLVVVIASLVVALTLGASRRTRGPLVDEALRPEDPPLHASPRVEAASHPPPGPQDPDQDPLGHML